MKQEIENFDLAIRAMLRLDIHYNKTASLEDGRYWREHNDRYNNIIRFCQTNTTAHDLWHLFCNSNMDAVDMIQTEALRGHPITEGFIEGVISSV